MGFEAVTLEITRKCNHSCIFCYNPEVDNDVDVSFEQIDFVVKKISDYGIQRVTVSGGEPFLLKKQTEHLIQRLCEEKLDICLNTNLTLIDSGTAGYLEKMIGHDNIVYSSIPSVKEDTCDRITRVPGSYQNVVRGIDVLKSHNMKIGLNMTVSPVNVNDLGLVSDFLSQNAVDSFTLFPVIPPIYDRNNIIHSNDMDTLKMVADTLVEIHDVFGITVGSIRPLPLCVIGGDNKYGIIKGGRCSTGIKRFAIEMGSGNMVACSQENKIYGNVYSDSIEECYEKMKDWRNSKYIATACRGCDKMEKCGGMCLWSNPCGRC